METPALSFGPDLEALIAARPSPLVSASPVTALPSPVRRRAAFRLDFADGTTLKGRRFETAEKAARVRDILDGLGDGFARIVAHRGDAMLLEWVAGPSLASLAPLDPALLERCGRQLAGLHLLPARGPTRDVAAIVTKLEVDLEVLRAAGRLDAGQAGAALGRAAAAAPAEVAASIVHRDYCAENLVLAERGPVSIDNANLSHGTPELDLARTWYLWPMSSAEEERFLGGYGERRGVDAFRERFDFWVLCTLAGSASSRLRAQTGREDVPLARLRAIIGRR